jgi:hypothetical protein
MLQELLVFLLAALSASYLIHRALRKFFPGNPKGCGGNCGCPGSKFHSSANKTITHIIQTK